MNFGQSGPNHKWLGYLQTSLAGCGILCRGNEVQGAPGLRALQRPSTFEPEGLLSGDRPSMIELEGALRDSPSGVCILLFLRLLPRTPAPFQRTHAHLVIFFHVHHRFFRKIIQI